MEQKTFKKRLELLIENQFNTAMPCDVDYMDEVSRLRMHEGLAEHPEKLREDYADLVSGVRNVHETHIQQDEDMREKLAEIRGVQEADVVGFQRILPIGLFNLVAGRNTLAREGTLPPLDESDYEKVFEAAENYYRFILQTAVQYIRENWEVVDDLLEKRSDLDNQEFYIFNKKKGRDYINVDMGLDSIAHVKTNCDRAGVDTSDIAFDPKMNWYFEALDKGRDQLVKLRAEDAKRQVQ